MANPPLPLVALTMGDPAGIGPEICLKAMHDAQLLSRVRILVVGDTEPLQQAAEQTGLAIPGSTITIDELPDVDLQALVPSVAFLDCAVCLDPVVMGRPSRIAGEASCFYIETATRLALDGRVDAICTGPITKTTLKLAEVDEPGHTEILARLCERDDYAMLLYSPRLAVSFVTCHQSLASVPGALTARRIRDVAHLMTSALMTIRGKQPRLGILGLNPHAGEEGLFGDEEIEIIAPAVEQCRADGLDVEGPIPPDAAFMPRALERLDGHVTMYHDQGGIPFKMVSLHDGVNVTMGLPIIRTSVDHGTAYDIAGMNCAEHSSLRAALLLAAQLASRRVGAAASR